MRKKNSETQRANKKLPSEQEKKFCHHFLQTFNAKSAIIFAGYNSENALIKAHELLNKPHMKNYIKRLQEEKQLNDFLSKQDVVKKYAELAFADLNDYISQNCDEVAQQSTALPANMQAQITQKESTTKGRAKAKSQTQNNEDDSPSNFNANFDGTLLNELKKTSDGISVKLPDRMKALAWLSDYFELNPNDVHRRELEKRKLELEAIKLSASENSGDKGEKTDEQSKEYWQYEFDDICKQEDESEYISENENKRSGRYIEKYEFNSDSADGFLSSAQDEIKEIWGESKNNDK